MNGTPRLRSAYPASPQQSPPQRGRTPARSNGIPSKPSPSRSGSQRLPDIGSLAPSKPKPQGNPPLIPFDIIDAPSQRLYVLGVWLLLLLWRLYDYYNLTVDETESLWQFMKWLSIDLVSLYVLETMRIPWMEFTPTTQITLFFVHALIDGLLMFRIPLPFGSLLVGLVRLLYDRELAISERYVKPGDIIHNPSHILGRQIIHVLPEGSAVLNPENNHLCLDSSKSSPSITLPIRINQTNPVSIELVRFDLDKPENETIVIASAQAKRLRKDASKGQSLMPSEPLTLKYPVKKTGLYRLVRVLDETKLEIKGLSEALIVTCPNARIMSSNPNRCRGDLSDLSLEVQGTPPLNVKYRKFQNGVKNDVLYESIQPEDFISPLLRQQNIGTLTSQSSFDISWARSHVIRVPLNESLTLAGHWTYTIEQVVDGSDNVVSYSGDEESESGKTPDGRSEARLIVHDRPRVLLQAHDIQRPFKVRKGGSVEFPYSLMSTGKGAIANTDHTLRYSFSPMADLTPAGEHGPNPELKEITVKAAGQKPKVRESGLYSLLSISTPFCQGEVLEPASFMLINPPEPDVSIATEEISDRCAGNPIGFRVHFDFEGTPPFTVRYNVKVEGNRQPKYDEQSFGGMRGQIEFKPPEAGHYTYSFLEVSDGVYKGVPLKHKNLVLEQDVKPSVSAHLLNSKPIRRLCIDQSADFDVKFQGEGPWSLEYEIVHGGKRAKHVISDIAEDIKTINTGPLKSGGEHSLVLTSVTDKAGCKEGLQEDAKISVRHQRPKITFGSVEGKYAVRTLEGKTIEIPLRLAGESPWTVDYEHHDGQSVEKFQRNFARPNDYIQARKRGTYKIVNVADSICPGVVETPDQFDIAWIPRPEVTVSQSPLLEPVDGQQVRKEVCEGEQDAVDILFSGKPPYEVKYKPFITFESGAKSTKKDISMNVPLNSAQIKMDTSQPGTYEYVFTELGDYNYYHDSKRHQPLTIRQKVYARPSVAFEAPGKVYSFCQSLEDDIENDNPESIPIRLTGQPPFTVDFELKQYGRSSARPELLTFSNIDSTEYNVRIPPRYLQPDKSILTIRRVRDSRGCDRIYDFSASSPGNVAPRVQISVHDLPTIAPLEERTHYCVGERIVYSLSGGAPPYNIFYTFAGRERKAVESSTVFRRLAETPGDFAITGIADSKSACRRAVPPASMHKVIHGLPSVRISKGKEQRVDIHAGGETDLHFDFSGISPFEFTYVRRENAKKGGKVGQVLETKTLVSEDTSLTLKAHDEGTYMVEWIADRYCSFPTGFQGNQRLLKN